MRKFTDVELEFTPKVAEVMGPHEYQKGDLIFNDGKVELYGGSFESRPFFKVGHCWFPLEHDCLEWLREKCKDSISTWTEPFQEHDKPFTVWFDEYKSTQVMGEGDTLLEALYRCIIGIGANA